MQSGQGFAFGKTLVTRHLARLHFTQSRLILNQPSQDAKAGSFIKSLTEFAAPQRREKDPIRFLRRRVRRKNTLRGAGLGPKELASADPTVDVGPESAFFCAARTKMRGSE